MNILSFQEFNLMVQKNYRDFTHNFIISSKAAFTLRINVTMISTN